MKLSQLEFGFEMVKTILKSSTFVMDMRRDHQF